MATVEHSATLWDALESSHEAPRCDAHWLRVEAALREAYFGDAAELAMRYGITADAVLAHVVDAGLSRRPRPERAIGNIRCAVHAAALVRGEPQSWADLMTALGPAFDRACVARLDRTRGIAFARRFWLDLRASSIDATRAPASVARALRTPLFERPRGVRPPDLRSFTATKPLRQWLAERLLGSLETELGRAASAAERLDTVEEVRTLRIPAQWSRGAEASRA